MKIKSNRMVLFLAFAVICYAFTGCRQHESLPPKEYVTFLNSEKCKLYSIKNMQGVKFIAKLQPPELITLLNSGMSYSSRADYENEKKYYAEKLNFVFLISDQAKNDNQVKATISKKEAYSELLSYANSSLQNDFSVMLPDGSVLPCSFVHLEAANSVQPMIRISVAFDNIDEALKDYTLIFDDNLFNTGKIKFHYSKEDFASLPKLKI